MNFLKTILINHYLMNEKIILINRCTDKIIKIIEELIDKNINDIIFIFNSEILDKKSKLRNFFEKSKNKLVSIAFYPDNFDTLLKIAQQTLKEKKILLSNECISIL